MLIKLNQLRRRLLKLMLRVVEAGGAVVEAGVAVVDSAEVSVVLDTDQLCHS